jgi:nicotinate-nucleotide adenylyltransferase
LNTVIGILGGTFDPPHWGHIKLAAHFSKFLQLDEFIWLPSGEPWQKSSQITPANERYRMTLAAAQVLKEELIKDQCRTKVAVSTMEIDRSGPSYTIDSAKELRQQYGNDVALIWLMGADSFLQLQTWNDWRDLVHFMHLAVASRPPHSIKTQLANHPTLLAHYQEHQTHLPENLRQQTCGLIYLDEQLSIDLASSTLRSLLSKNQVTNSLQECLPQSVRAIISEKGLYQSKVR